MSDELRQLQREYLDDVRSAATIMRAHGAGLRDEFKTAFPALLYLAHQLKGSGGSLGFPRISEVARRISEQLNLFLDEEQPTRPSPEEMSQRLALLSGELEREVSTAQQALQ